MPTVVRLLQRPPRRYERHKNLESCMHTLRRWNIFYLRQCILLHRLVRLRSGSEASCQRHEQHRPYLRSMPHREILYRVQPEHMRELDSMQRNHRNREQRRFYDGG